MTAASRLDRARAILDAEGLDGLLVSRPAGRRWLANFRLRPGEETTSGWSGSLLVTADANLLLADARYTEQAEHDSPGWSVRLTSDSFAVELPRVAGELGVRRLGAEAEVLVHADWAALEAGGLEPVAVDEPLAALRRVKDPDEVDAIARACALTDACFEHLLATVRPGLTEAEVSWQITSWFRTNGAEGNAFEPLVLVGARAAMPHGHPSDTVVRADQPLLIDFGCQVDGYRSDMTRTIFFGEPDAEARRKYEAVLDAQQRAIDAAAAGVAAKRLHAIAVERLAEDGLADAFTHGLGHGIGLETHEAPSLKTWDGDLATGMVFTVEPGVYLPGEIGIRIEDDLVLEASGPRLLTTAPRELLVV